MGDPYNQKKFIESEMDRFEQEISSLAPTTMSRSFIPAQLRKPGAPAQMKPSPIFISGAPQVYNAGPSGKPSETIAAPPKLNFSAEPSGSGSAGSSAVISKSSTVSSSSSITPGSSGGTIVKPLEAMKVKSSLVDTEKKKKKKKKKDDKDKKPKKALRCAGGQVWEDLTLQDWDPSDFRLFCGDLGNDVTDEVLTRVFSRYPSFQKAKVVRDKRSNKSKGFGFVSFKDPADFSRAIKEIDGRYVGSRPIKLRKSNWKSRNIDEARKKEKERQQLLALVKK